MKQQVQIGSIRKYSLIFLFSILSLGIYYLVYQFWLFKDLTKHHENAFQQEPEAYPTLNNPITLFIFLFFLPIYTVYVKYNILHEHISTSNLPHSINCVMGYKAVLFFIFFGIPTLGIVPIIMEYRWQKTFNQHIEAHKLSMGNE